MFTQFSPPKITYFSCSGSDSWGLLKSGYFQKLLNFDESLVDESILKSCENQITSSSIFSNMRKTFVKIKQKFQFVKDITMRNSDIFSKESEFLDVNALRMDILKIFQMYIANLRKFNSGYHDPITPFSNFSSESVYLKNIFMQLASEIKNLLICIGRISSIPDINTVTDISSDTSKSAVGFYNFLHLCLDIWFNCLAILYMIHSSVPVEFKDTFCDFCEHSSAFLQVASFLIFDLSLLSINRCTNFHVKDDTPFLCPCLKDLWIMLIKLSDRHSERKIFFNIFLSNLQIILKKTSQDVKDISIDKFSISISTHSDSHKLLESCFWLTLHVMSLCKYNIFGDINEHENINGGSIVGKYLIESLLDSEVSEKRLCSCLSYCIELSKLCGASTDISFPLTNFFVGNIDKTYSSMQEINFSYLFKDSKTWYVYIENLSNLVAPNKETSFDYFLSILSQQICLDSDNNLWRALRGRIYSKLTPKKIKEMQETGLQNFFSLYLILVLSGLSEVAVEICKAASIIEKLANPRKQLISWKAMFVLLYINQAKKCDSGKVTGLLSDFFKSACADYSKINRDSIFKNNLMTLLLVYIDNTKDIFESNNGFSLSTYQLIGTGFSDLLKSCSLSDQNYILRVILNILQKMQKINDSHNIDYVVSNTECNRTLQVIFDNIYPFIESVVNTETVPSVISEIAVVLTKLTFTFASAIRNMEFDYYKIFMFFACKEAVNSNITCLYLSLIYDHPQIVEEIKLRYSDLDVLIFQSWLKCLINLQTENENLEDLTKKVIQLPIIKGIVPTCKINYETKSVIDMVCALFGAIGTDFAHHNMQEKIIQAKKVQSLFKNYATLAVNKILKHKETPIFSQIINYVYKITSLLIENCSSVLHYRVSSESILLQILDNTIYPQLLFAGDRELQNKTSYVIKEHLPCFIRGLFRLDYRKDASIKREIRDIFMYYIEIRPLSSNPLIKLFCDSLNQKSGGLNVDAWLFVLETLKSHLISKNPENSGTIIQFYMEIFLRSPPVYKKDITSIILQCAMSIFMERNDAVIESKLLELIKTVLMYFKDKGMQPGTKDILKPVVMWFVQEKLKWQINRGFTLLDYFVDYVPHIMLDLVEFIKKSIEDIEKERGLGEDKPLRNGFHNIIAKLQLKFNKSHAV